MLLTFMYTSAVAQPNLAFYPFNKQFNSSDYNPAFLTSHEKFTFSIFPLAGTSIGYNNQRVIKNLASKFLTGVITDQDFTRVLNSLGNQPSFYQNIESSLLSFTYRSEIGFFNFRIKDSEYFMASLDGDVTQFIFDNKVPSVVIGQPQSLPVQAVHYREYSLGYSYKSLSNRFSAGIRAKLYYGKSALFTNITGSIQSDQTNPNDYVFKTSGPINISFPKAVVNNTNAQVNTIDFSSSTVFNYLFNNGNPGMGVDLGINYRIRPNLSFSMSVIDLGKINWRKNLYTVSDALVYKLFKSYRPDIIDGVPILFKREGFTNTDSLSFGELVANNKRFSKPLPATIYAGLKYKVSPIFSLNITDRLIVVKDLSYNSLSVTGKVDVNKILSFSSGYSIIGDSYLNIPLAFMFQGNFGQFFIGTDNLTSILLPNYGQFAGISFGACFYLFTKRNLNMKPSDLNPFYRPRKIIKNPRTGLTNDADEDFE